MKRELLDINLIMYSYHNPKRSTVPLYNLLDQSIGLTQFSLHSSNSALFHDLLDDSNNPQTENWYTANSMVLGLEFSTEGMAPQ